MVRMKSAGSDRTQGSRPRASAESGHPHGRPASWILVAIVTLAFALGGAALIMQTWLLFWACAGTVLLCVPAGWLIGIMDDTVGWTTAPAREYPNGRVIIEASRLHEQEVDGQPASQSAHATRRQTPGAGARAVR